MTKAPDTQFKLRLPANLKDRLDAAAASSGLSLTAEIVRRLEMSFQGDRKSAFELLTKTLLVITSTEDALKRIQDELGSFAAGDRDALAWLEPTDQKMSAQELTSAAGQIIDVFCGEIQKARGYVPILIAATKGDGSVPDEIHRFLSRRNG